MLSIKWIRNNKEAFQELLKRRNIQHFNLEELLSLDEESRQIITLIQHFRQSKSKKSQELAKLRGVSNRDIITLKRDIGHIDEKLKELSKKSYIQDKINNILSEIPNLLDEDVPWELGEKKNKIIKVWGGVEKKLPFTAKMHDKLMEDLQMVDLVNTAKFSGSKFVTLRKDLAKLNRALINFMIDHNVSKGFEELDPPHVVKASALYNTGQLYKFQKDLYLLENDKLGLIPTGEVPLVNMCANDIIKFVDLPVRFTSFTACYRREAGAAGNDTRGLMRNHQFGKVEIVSITDEVSSTQEHEFLLFVVEDILKKLDIPYRVVLLCAGDTGFSSSKTFDIEVWLPASGIFKEISSISNCKDFQARRASIRYKDAKNNNIIAHSLNASSLAVGRTIVAILENYQNSDGSVSVPNALVSYMNGQKIIQK